MKRLAHFIICLGVVGALAIYIHMLPADLLAVLAHKAGA